MRTLYVVKVKTEKYGESYHQVMGWHEAVDLAKEEIARGDALVARIVLPGGSPEWDRLLAKWTREEGWLGA